MNRRRRRLCELLPDPWGVAFHWLACDRVDAAAAACRRGWQLAIRGVWIL